ncbi:tRNA1(Val) (adenine(37)-N6)-methyltransferase [Oharaeibacter diazotrophicus]|uniref:tRNA1(Val) A37 N6-methylase TrmN6 n=2 Tax=Oharaeibacter diazotrophicus TaxID=1920512 RepID=A0A4R6RM89_9HYPH|nr:tRNA1(Val) A37 N6-methylase TrmN6 [Oharaeibacter diazotrophicus]BBE70930.1 tRNA1(Val) (adenine(37)-N6)-methyltransferase [Pleomorphomonas sp. SM30]GLS77679.1 methyltransferase [Oharaeibacter diazotrophicus]
MTAVDAPAEAAPDPDAITRDGFLGGRLVVAQARRGAHRAGLDAVLLAAALPDGTRGHVLDLGAGVGVAGMAAACRLAEVTVDLVEIDPDTAVLARDNVAANAGVLGGRVAVIEADVLAPAAVRAAAGLVPNGADHVVLNPPFHPADRARPSPAADRARAHSLPADDLERWMRAAVRLARPGGTVTIVFRADELPRLFAAIGPRLGSLSVLPVHARAGEAAIRVLVRGRPQGRAPLRLLPGFVLHEGDGGWRPEADAVLRGAALPVTWW